MENSIEKQKIAVSDLVFREITDDVAPEVINKLVQKEAVHKVSADRFAANRMAPPELPDDMPDRAVWDKRAFGLFAPGRAIPEVVVYVKLMDRKTGDDYTVPNEQLTGNILALVNEAGKPIESPNCAIFYSITNTALMPPQMKPDPNHPVEATIGPDEIKAGERLIREVAAKLQKEQVGVARGEQIKPYAFTTLSPLRQGEKGFATWLKQALDQKKPEILTAFEKVKLTAASPAALAAPSDFYEIIVGLHKNFNKLGNDQQQFFRNFMEDLGMYYLAEAKSPPSPKKPNAPAEPFDRVEAFHLSNGAELAHIHYHPPEKTTEKESELALGLMANYRYEPDLLDEKKHMYKNGKIVMDAKLRTRHEARMQELDTPGLSIIPNGAQSAPICGGLSQIAF